MKRVSLKIKKKILKTIVQNVYLPFLLPGKIEKKEEQNI